VTIGSAVRDVAVPAASRPRRWGWWLAVGWLIVVVVGAVWLHSWRHNHVSFGPAAIDPHLVGLQVLTPTSKLAPNVQRAVQALGAADSGQVQVNQSRTRRQYVVGRIDVLAHPAPEGSQYALVVIDNRTHTVLDDIEGLPEHHANGDGSGGSGWDYGMAKFASKYPWLSPLRELGNANSGYRDPGSAVMFTPGSATQLPFSAVLRAGALPVTNIHRDLTIALVMLGPDRQPYWATRLN
jgi:hypothetical protein